MATEMVYQRDVYGKTLVELGKQDPRIVVMDADLSGSTRTALFAREFPERFFNCGVAEQNMMAMASGLASCGKIVFVSTFAMFATGRAWDQVRNSICYSKMNVKIVATHAGITVGPDGATHQALEDIAIMRAIPQMKVVVPCDGPQTAEAIRAIAAIAGPCYVRLGRAKFPSVEGKSPFALGQMQCLRQGTQIALFACGLMVKQALEAQQLLAQEGISAAVYNIHTIKPLDQDAVVAAARRYQGVVICEEHSVIGGLCSAVAEVLAPAGCPVRVAYVAVGDSFGQSGESDELLAAYQLMPQDIVRAARRIREQATTESKGTQHASRKRPRAG